MNENQLKMNQLIQLQALPLSAKIRLTEMRIREWYDAFDGNVYVAYSGGKDSTVMLDIIRRLYPEVPAVFSDTGNELASVLKFVRTYGESVTWVRPERTYEEVVERWGYPVISKKLSDYINRVRRTKSEQVKRRHLKGENADGTPSPASKIPDKWQYVIDAPFDVTSKCCGILKDRPTSKYRKDTNRKAFVGTMAEESNVRLNSYLNHGGCNAFDQQDQCSRPIMFWTEQDVLGYLLDKGIKYADCYGDIVCNRHGKLELTGEKRTGCKFCLLGIQFDKGENRIQRLSRTEPESYRHAIEDLGYDKVMDFIGVDYRPYIQPDVQLDMLDSRYNINADELA